MTLSFDAREPIIQVDAAMCRLGKTSIHHEGQGAADVQPIRGIKRK